MSSRMSGSTGEGLRTPLRSLDNEIQLSSTPSPRFKSKSQEAVKMTVADSLSDPESRLDSSPSKGALQTSPPSTDITTASGLGDVTFKSFICAGGEVEIPGSSFCAEESIILPKDQATYNNETEDTVISQSMIVESCCDHKEHPYHNPDMKEHCSVDTSTAHLCEVQITPVSATPDDKQATQDARVFENDCSEDKQVTWKSFACDGGEIEVSDSTRLQDETIPLPKVDLGGPVQDNSINSTSYSYDCGDQCEVDRADHPYFSSELPIIPIITTLFETTDDFEKPDVTFKSFNCTGGVNSQRACVADQSVPLPADHTVSSSESHDNGTDPSVTAGDHDLQGSNNHLDQLHVNIQNYSSPPRESFFATQEPSLCSTGVAVANQISLVVPDSQAVRQEGVTSSSTITTEGEVEHPDDNQWSEKTFPHPEDQAVICQPLDENDESASVAQGDVQDDNTSQSNKDNAVVESDSPAISGSSLSDTSVKDLDNETVNCQVQETSKSAIHPKDSSVPSMVQRTEIPDCSHLTPSAEVPSGGLPDPSESKDSAIGSSGNGPALCNPGEKPAENLPDVLKVLSKCPSLASDLQFLSPVVKRASLPSLKAHGNELTAQDQFLADDSALDDEKSLLAPVNIDPAGLWAEYLESPMPRPLFNSTTLSYKPRPGPVSEPVEDVEEKDSAVPQSEVKKPVLDIPMIPDGPLQQQLRQMAEFLILASGKMEPAVVPASGPPSAVLTVPSAKAATVESHSICVGTSPLKVVDRSLNTSGVFKREREFSVVDSCTMTDPLLWNLLQGTLESLPRQELEQRLRSSMVMVEALVQQLASARTQVCPAGPAPSDLREKLVQTDHTELSQTSMYRDLYMEALKKIDEVELGGRSLQSLTQSMKDMRITMAALSNDTDAALCNMKEMSDVVKEDHQNLVSHYEHMKTLFEKSKDTQTRMMQKVKEALGQRNDMKTQMEEAFSAKEAVFSAMEQLRTHCAAEISALEKSVGCQQDLLAALNQTYPEQVALNKTCAETLNSASDLLSQTLDDQSSLRTELYTVRNLLQKSAPILLKLNEKAAAALRERDEHISARDKAFEEREQIEEELNETQLNLQTARQEISDLNLQVTILSSEMGVLREKLTEKSEESGLLERKVTELSATVSSTLASYTFLEQALAAETTKLQQSWKDIQQTRERADELEASLGQSEQRVFELSQALVQSEEELGQLQTLSQSQSTQIQQLQDVCTQLSGVREMNEFLQMENELAREQVAESERLLRTNLQALRERNIQCEDLKEEVRQLQLENINLQEELETTRSRESASQLEFGEKIAQAVTEITLLHHTLRGLTNELHAVLRDEKAEPQKDKESQSVHRGNPHQFSSSFVDSIMVALTTEEEEDVKTDTHPDTVPSESDTLFSDTSAFTRIAAITPKKNLNVVEFEPEKEEQRSVADMLADLGTTVTELVSTLEVVQQRKDAQLAEMHNTICGLQVEHEAANSRHEAEVSELKHQLGRMNNLVDRGNQALQQRAQDEKNVAEWMAEVQEAQEILNKHKTENNELRKEVTELRRACQQSKVESQFLREELRKAGGQSANPAHVLEEKIQLLKEVERLKASLQEADQARVKLLERAKRHQMIHQANQQKSENELQILNHMINKIRETLLSLPEAVKNSEQLQQLVEYIG